MSVSAVNAKNLPNIVLFVASCPRLAIERGIALRRREAAQADLFVRATPNDGVGFALALDDRVRRSAVDRFDEATRPSPTSMTSSSLGSADSTTRCSTHASSASACSPRAAFVARRGALA
jgi:hypothetical protein